MNDTTVTGQRLDLDDAQRWALIAGGAGAVLLVIGALLDLDQLFRSYLLGFMAWGGIAVGCLGLATLHVLTGGQWGMAARRVLEAGARTMPLVALLFVPLAFGLPALYEWAHPEVVAEDALLAYKQPWLNGPFFLLRAGLYLAIWTGIAYLLTSRAWALDRSADPDDERRLRQVSSLSLVALGITVTFAAFDWLMSLEPHWFSSIFGAVVGVSMILAALAVTVIALTVLADREPLHEVLTPAIFNDLGSLLLAFTMIWAYLQLSQYLIIWSGNIPEEVTWYLNRTEGGWYLVALGLIAFHFALPFVLLLARRVRAEPRNLARLAAFLLLMYVVNLLWLIRPTFAHTVSIHWLDVAAIVALGGFWVAFFVWQVKRLPSLVPRPALPILRERAQHAH